MITKPCKHCDEGAVEFAMTGGHSTGGQPLRHGGECSTCHWPHYIMVDNRDIYAAYPVCLDSTYVQPPTSRGIRAGHRVERSTPMVEVPCRLPEGHDEPHEGGPDGSVRW